MSGHLYVSRTPMSEARRQQVHGNLLVPAPSFRREAVTVFLATTVFGLVAFAFALFTPGA